MKIYYNKNHQPGITKQLSSDAIPLAYIDNGETDYVSEIHIRPDMARPYRETAVKPCQVLDTDHVLLFDKDKKPVWNMLPYIKQQNGIWTVMPQDATVFWPKEFTYSVLLQRDDTYNKEHAYDISVCFDYDPDRDTKVQRALLSILSSLGNTKRYPSNIKINGGDVTQRMLVNLERLQLSCDLLCKAYTNTLDIDKILATHTNLWLYINDTGLDDTSSFVHVSEDSLYASYRLQEGTIFSSSSGTLEPNADGKYTYFDTDEEWDYITDKDGYEEIFLFSSGAPIRIFHKKNEGFVVFSSLSFLEKMNAADNDSHLRLFMEILLYIYLHGYHKTKERISWITDEFIDYWLSGEKPYRLSHPDINLPRILAEERYETKPAYRIVSVEAMPKGTDSFQVSYVGQTRFGSLLFMKQADVKDPEKGNKILIYTTDHSLLLCDPDDVGLRMIESGVVIRRIDDRQFGIGPISSSQYKVYTEEETILSVNGAGTYAVFYQDGSIQISLLSEVPAGTVVLAEINVSINEEIAYKDIRILGGGEASAEPNYEMIDTGNLYGRPYRYGCPMVIQLPARYKPMQTEIRSEIEKHIASGDYPIILYKD